MIQCHSFYNMAFFILNLTQHTATPEQIAAGVVEPTPEQRAEIVRLLTFDELPDSDDIRDRAYELALIARQIIDAKFAQMSREERDLELRHGSGICAMIGGAPFLMAALADELAKVSIHALFAFSMRESIEDVQPDGSVRKTAVFRHKGFVPAL